jgi:hypothetical protein
MGKMGKVEAANERLKAAGVPVRLKAHGQALYLRTPKSFPPKPGDPEGKRYEIPQGPVGAVTIRKAENTAHSMWAAVVERRFDWADYSKTAARRGTVGHWVEVLKAEHTKTGRCSERTWQKHWIEEVFSRLPQDGQLTSSLILGAVLKTPENTRLRRVTCQRLGKLAKVAGLDCDLSPYQGTYGHSSVARRDLPTDEQIEAWYQAIRLDSWKMVYARIVAFGLRPSEAFQFELIDPHTAQVVDAKSGMVRETKAFHPRWAEQWPMVGPLPEVTWRPDRRAHDLTMRIRMAFKRAGVTCDRYTLRHAWCVRGSVEYKMPTSLMARWAGHSAEVHDALYLKWMRKDQGDRAYRQMALEVDSDRQL